MSQTASPPARSPMRPRHRASHIRHRALILLPLVLILLVAAGLVWEGWSYSSQLLGVAPHRPNYSVRVFAVQGGLLTLARTSMTARPGIYGLDLPRGHAILGPIVRTGATKVVRRLLGPARGLAAGAFGEVDISPYLTPADLHLAYRTVQVPTSLGPMPAWYLPGRRHTWAILVHGWQSDRTDGLRAAPTLAGLGLPVLDITYRNDRGAPLSPDRLYHLGATEWQDVQAAARYAQAHGARGFVLYGFSMGGNVVESFLHHSPLAGRVQAVVLDSPALDWSAVLDWHAKESSLPVVFQDVELPIIKRISAWRLGLGSLDAIDQLRQANSLRAPTLVFHGTSDTMVPYALSAALARARPHLVTLVPVPGAAHIGAWNINPRAYDQKLRSFLTATLHLR